MGLIPTSKIGGLDLPAGLRSIFHPVIERQRDSRVEETEKRRIMPVEEVRNLICNALAPAELGSLEPV